MPYDFSKLSVLVVEDSAPMLEVVTQALEHLGVGKVFQATDGEQAFREFTKQQPDIVLTDWEMEPVDGLELSRWIRKDSPKRNTPVIMMTGYGASLRVSDARDCGITEFLVKPFTANELARRVAYVIDHPRDFVETERFFGPDRRRRKADGYDGPDRRGGDE